MSIPVFLDPFRPHTRGLLGYWIRCLLGTQPLRWFGVPTPAEALQRENFIANLRDTAVLWVLPRTPAEIELAYSSAFPAPGTVATWDAISMSAVAPLCQPSPAT